MKKIILGLVVIVMSFVLVGCNNNVKTVEGNKAFGEYTGIYKLGKNEFKMVQFKDKIMILAYNKGELCGNPTIFVENGKAKEEEYDFEFKENAVKIKSRSKLVKSGEYKRIKAYSTKEIYKDYVGDINLSNSHNGVYKNDVATIYTIQTDKNTIRFATYFNESGLNLEANKVSKNNYSCDFLEEKYELTYTSGILELKVDSQEENKKLSGKYTKEKEISNADIVKIFAFDSLMEQ